MVGQIVCNIFMFAFFGANLLYLIVSLITLAHKLKILDATGSDFEAERFHSLRKEYLGSILKLLIVNVISLLISAVTCLLDGLSDTENGLIVPTFVFLSIALFLTLFFFVYTDVLRKKYKIRTAPTGGDMLHNCPIDLIMGILISFIYAFNSALNAYTIYLLLI